jgi:hypothetical protein
MENGTCCTCKKERNKQKKRKRVERRKEEVGIRPSFDEVAWDQEERRRQQGKAIVQRQLQQLEEKLSQYPRLHRQANIDLQRKQQRRQGETMDQWVDRLVAMEALAKRLIHTKEEVEWPDEKDLAENGRQKECPILECTISAELEAEEANKEVVKNVKKMIITRLKKMQKKSLTLQRLWPV